MAAACGLRVERVVNTRIVSESHKALVVMPHKADVTSTRRRRRRPRRRRPDVRSAGQLSRKYDLDDGDGDAKLGSRRSVVDDDDDDDVSRGR